MRLQPAATMPQFCLVSFGRPYIGKPIGRGEWCLLPDDQCKKLGDWLQRSSGRSNRTCVPEVYRDFPYHDDGLHLDGGVADEALW